MCGEAENGRDAIEKAKELKPDLIVLDLAMPIMNGLEAAPVLRRMLPTAPIIVFTLYGNKYLEQAALSAGVTAVVSKLANVETLVNQAPSPATADGMGKEIKPFRFLAMLDDAVVCGRSQQQNSTDGN
jgi:CheY-like chemotaxis protein